VCVRDSTRPTKQLHLAGGDLYTFYIYLFIFISKFMIIFSSS
jgi:hypothetical protein